MNCNVWLFSKLWHNPLLRTQIQVQVPWCNTQLCQPLLFQRLEWVFCQLLQSMTLLFNFGAFFQLFVLLSTSFNLSSSWVSICLLPSTILDACSTLWTLLSSTCCWPFFWSLFDDSSDMMGPALTMHLLICVYLSSLLQSITFIFQFWLIAQFQ